jgi:hypothetical protein
VNWLTDRCNLNKPAFAAREGREWCFGSKTLFGKGVLWSVTWEVGMKKGGERDVMEVEGR